MNNEPVALTQVEIMEALILGIPLYTHPVKELTDEEFDKIFANGKRLGVLETEDRFRKAMNLTDEEIEEVTNTIEWRESDWLWELDFARAILRKAQEK